MGNPAGVRRDFKALEQRRRRAAALLAQGVHQSEVARRVGVSPESVRRWRLALEAEGARGLRGAGRAGRKPRLSPAQLRTVARELKRGPQALGYETALWTAERVADLIERACGVRYHAGHVWKILRDMGRSCRTWAPTGQTPVLQYHFGWKTLSAKVGITWLRFYFRLFPQLDSRTAGDRVSAAIAAPQTGDLMVVLDGLRVHHSRAVRDFVASQGGRIELQFVPAYAPELNPNRVHLRHLKQHEIPNFCPREQAQLSRIAIRNAL